jgi:hypothetical protein
MGGKAVRGDNGMYIRNDEPLKTWWDNFIWTMRVRKDGDISAVKLGVIP